MILPGMLAIGIAPLADKALQPKADVKSAMTLQIEKSNPELAQRLAAHNVPSMEELTALGGRGLVPPKIDQKSIEVTPEGGKKGNIVFKKQGDGQPILDKAGKPIVELDYDLVIPMMLHKYFPAGLLGLGLCALMASFMSGMAGNTTPSIRSGPTIFINPTSAKTPRINIISGWDAMRRWEVSCSQWGPLMPRPASITSWISSSWSLPS